MSSDTPPLFDALTVVLLSIARVGVFWVLLNLLGMRWPLALLVFTGISVAVHFAALSYLSLHPEVPSPLNAT